VVRFLLHIVEILLLLLQSNTLEELVQFDKNVKNGESPEELEMTVKNISEK